MTDFNREIDAFFNPDLPAIYFARPQSCYAANGSTLDSPIIRMLEVQGFQVIDPGSQEIGELFARYREENPDNYMPFFKMVCDRCDALAMMPFPDDQQAEGVPNVPLRIGAGVWYEAESVFARGAPVYLVENNGQKATICPIDNFEGLTKLDRDQTIRLLALSMPLYRQRVAEMDNRNAPPNCS